MLLAEAAGAIGSAQRKYLTRIKAGAERMASMTDDLIREAGVEEQWSGPQRQSVDVSSFGAPPYRAMARRKCRARPGLNRR